MKSREESEWWRQIKKGGITKENSVGILIALYCFAATGEELPDELSC